jgi:hypothetical protein
MVSTVKAPRENHAVIFEYARSHPLAFQFFARVFGYPLGERRRSAESLRRRYIWWPSAPVM